MKSAKHTTIIALAAAAALSGCKNKGENQAAAMPPPPVEVAHPVKKTLELWEPFVARIDSLYSVDIQARVGGYLQSIHFKDGDFIKQGDLLFVIDPRPFEAVVDAGKAQVKQAQARLLLAKENQERGRAAFESKAISKEVLDTRNNEVLTSEAVLLSAQASLREAELNLEFTHIRAPISGHVSRRYVDAGNLIPSGQSPVLASMVSKEKVYAYFEVSERDVIRYLENGMQGIVTGSTHDGPPVRFTLAEGGKVYTGKVTYADPAIDRASATLTMRAELDNEDGKLMPGMFASLELRASAPKEYLMLPEAVINTDLQDRYVIVIGEDDVAKFTTVKPGRLIGNNMRIIEGGVNENDRVLIKGAFRAVPGVKVAPKLIKIEE